MLGSWFSQLATTSAALLAVVFVAMLRAGRHSHKAVPPGAARRRGLVLTATAVALGALGVCAALGAGAVSAALTAVVLGGSVLLSASLVDRWSLRGVVAWALAATTAASVTVWGLHRVVTSSLSPAQVVASGSLLLVVGWLLARLRGRAEAWVSSRAGLATAEVRGADVGQDAGATLPLLLSGALVAFASVGATGVALTVAEPGQRAQAPVPGPRADGSPGSFGSSVTLTRPSGRTAVSVSTPPQMVQESTVAGTSQTPPLPLDRQLDTAVPNELLASADTTVTSAAASAPAPATTPPAPTKTPGYAKDKPRRPSDAPAVGPGQPAP